MNKNIEYNWQEIGKHEDDYLCRMPNDIMLRVEQMTEHSWWWCAGGLSNYDVEQWATNKEEAMKLAQNWYEQIYVYKTCEPPNWENM